MEDIINEYGVGLSLILRRRIFPVHFEPIQSHYELKLLFKQLEYDNLKDLAYNEEPVALKQAAILEVISHLEAR